MLIGIVAIPYIYEHIGVERIGVLTIIWALIGYFSIFDFGLGRAITQRIASLGPQHSEERKKTIATTGVFLTLLIGVVGSLVGLTALELTGVRWINSATHLDSEIRSSLFLACIAIPATTATAGLRGVLEGEQKFKAINLLKIILGLSNFLGPMASIALFGPMLEYIVGALVVFRYVILGAHHFYAKHALGNSAENLSRKETKQLFQFGGWMTLANIISPLMVVADRFVIANILGAGSIAYYTIPAEFMMRLLVLPASLSITLFPIFSRNISNNKHTESKLLYRKSMKIIFAMMGCIAICVILGSKFGLEIWLGDDFAIKSTSVTSILAIGILFNSIAQIPTTYIQAASDARAVAVIHVVELVIYIPVLLFMLKFFGINGAALAWAIRAALDLSLLQLRASNIKRQYEERA